MNEAELRLLNLIYNLDFPRLINHLTQILPESDEVVVDLKDILELRELAKPK